LVPPTAKKDWPLESIVYPEGDRRFDSPSLQRGVSCEPNFQGRIPSMTVGDFARPVIVSDGQSTWMSRIGFTPKRSGSAPARSPRACAHSEGKAYACSY
jgi:hypothetical protein